MNYQIVTLRVPFDPTLDNGTDAQGTPLGGEVPPYLWDWMALCGTIEPVVLLDCDPVSTDPDVQPIERLPDEPPLVLHGPEFDVWSEHPLYPRSNWQEEAGNGDTNLGYWEWCAHQAEDPDHPANQT